MQCKNEHLGLSKMKNVRSQIKFKILFFSKISNSSSLLDELMMVPVIASTSKFLTLRLSANWL